MPETKLCLILCFASETLFRKQQENRKNIFFGKTTNFTKGNNTLKKDQCIRDEIKFVL